MGRTLNPRTLAAAKRGRGPFSFVRHVGRRSGRTFETPLVLARVPDGFVAELTYGADVNWYRNIVAAGGEIGHRGRMHRIVSVENLDRDAGLRAFGGFRRILLRILRRHEFRLIRVEDE
nr:nitroreductase family deazaflavin-dependent oxidoreductase [Microbacterium ulmi]